MKKIRQITNIVLIVLLGFLAITSVLGGVALMAGFNSPPVSQLQGTIFNNFLIPGLALSLAVGGSATITTILLIRKSKFAALCSTITGVIIMFFEFIEVLMIGSPPGVARTLQIFYFAMGTLIAIFSVSLWLTDMLSEKKQLP